ncbi:hypothetical protein LUZ60_006591 [Juncus effusus]|nr:hypothetical protein LUZ60_006591 [Juncus effusus]
MEEDWSESSAGQVEADCREVESKDMTEAMDPTCTSWTNEKHLLYIVSLEESFMNQLYGSPFHLHFKNLIGQNKRCSNSSITTQNHSQTSQFKVLKQGCWKNMNFEERKSRVQSPQGNNAASAISVSPWIRHFKSRGETRNSNPGFEVHTCNTESVEKGNSFDLKESTSQVEVSYEEVSDQNFMETESNESSESSSTHKRKRSINDQVVPSGKLLTGEESAKT